MWSVPSQLGLVGWVLQARHGARLRVWTAPGSASTPHFRGLGDEYVIGYGDLRNTLVRDPQTPPSSQIPGCWVPIFSDQKLSHPVKGCWCPGAALPSEPNLVGFSKAPAALGGKIRTQGRAPPEDGLWEMLFSPFHSESSAPVTPSSWLVPSVQTCPPWSVLCASLL